METAFCTVTRNWSSALEALYSRGGGWDWPMASLRKPLSLDDINRCLGFAFLFTS